MRYLLAPLFVLLALGTAHGQEAPPRTGTFTANFAETSPLTSKAELSKRFPRENIPTYEIDKETFLLHVPEDYSPTTPYGLIVFLNYKDSDAAPEHWPPVLAKRRLIYVMSTRQPADAPVAAALAADAVHNVSKLYNVDRDRTYLMGVSGALCAALSYGDLFSGSLVWGGFTYFRPITDPKTRGTYPAGMPRIQGPGLAAAKQRPLIVATRPDLDETTARYYELGYPAMRQDGFRLLKGISINKDQFHYPDLSPTWMEEALDYFESTRPATRPTIAAAQAPQRKTPSTKPTLSEPRRQLTVAQFFIKNKAYPSARERLEKIIQDYPNDPVAVEAKALLDSISKNPPNKIEWRIEIRSERP